MALSNETRETPRSLMALFWAQVAAFAALLSSVLFPFLRTFVRSTFLPLMGVNFILGLVLFVLSIRAKRPGPLRKFLILTGASSTGFAVFGVLHNVFYGLATLTGDWPILNYAMKGLEVAFFVIAVFLCPICFVVGIVGAVVVLLKRGQPDSLFHNQEM